MIWEILRTSGNLRELGPLYDDCYWEDHHYEQKLKIEEKKENQNCFKTKFSYSEHITFRMNGQKRNE